MTEPMRNWAEPTPKILTKVDYERQIKRPIAASLYFINNQGAKMLNRYW